MRECTLKLCTIHSECTFSVREEALQWPVNGWALRLACVVWEWRKRAVEVKLVLLPKASAIPIA